jgi:hypothetical protein
VVSHCISPAIICERHRSLFQIDRVPTLDHLLAKPGEGRRVPVIGIVHWGRGAGELSPASVHVVCRSRLLKTNLTFRISTRRSAEEKCQFVALSRGTTRADLKPLFNGASSPASLDHCQHSHACPPRRYHAAVEWTARAAPHRPHEADARQIQIFGELQCGIPAPQSIATRAGAFRWDLNANLVETTDKAFPSPLRRDLPGAPLFDTSRKVVHNVKVGDWSRDCGQCRIRASVSRNPPVRFPLPTPIGQAAETLCGLVTHVRTIGNCWSATCSRAAA